MKKENVKLILELLRIDFDSKKSATKRFEVLVAVVDFKKGFLNDFIFMLSGKISELQIIDDCITDMISDMYSDSNEKSFSNFKRNISIEIEKQLK